MDFAEDGTEAIRSLGRASKPVEARHLHLKIP